MFELRHTFLESIDIDRFARLANRYAGMGSASIRYTPRWPQIEPQPGVYDFVTSGVDAAIDAITSAGMNVYLNPCDIPSHALGYSDDAGQWRDHPWEGSRTWFPPTGKQVWPTCWKPGTSEYDPSISAECANPPQVNPSSARRFGEALAQRYGNRVAYYGVPLNESDDPTFFPRFILARTRADVDWSDVAKETYDSVCAPFAVGVRTVLPDAVVCGPESQTYGYLAAMLQREKERGDRTFTRIATHGYAGAGRFPDDAIKRLTDPNGGLFPFLRDSGAWNDRPVDIGETGVEHGEDPRGILNYLPAAREEGISAVTCMMGRHFFKDGTFDNGTYEPNELYEEVRVSMNRLSIRHRAAEQG